jgi:hypothetical protein
MAFEIVPDLLCGVKLWCIGGELFQMQPGISPLDGGDRRPLVNRALIPQDNGEVSVVLKAGLPQDIVARSAMFPLHTGAVTTPLCNLFDAAVLDEAAVVIIIKGLQRLGYRRVGQEDGCAS